jgi:hypothetical protein
MIGRTAALAPVEDEEPPAAEASVVVRKLNRFLDSPDR